MTVNNDKSMIMRLLCRIWYHARLSAGSWALLLLMTPSGDACKEKSCLFFFSMGLKIIAYTFFFFQKMWKKKCSFAETIYFQFVGIAWGGEQHPQLSNSGKVLGKSFIFRYCLVFVPSNYMHVVWFFICLFVF